MFSIITPVFSVTWSFRHYSNMLISCSRNIWKLLNISVEIVMLFSISNISMQALRTACGVMICSKSIFGACKVHWCLATRDWLCYVICRAHWPVLRKGYISETEKMSSHCSQFTVTQHTALFTQFSWGDANIESSLMILAAVSVKRQLIIIKWSNIKQITTVEMPVCGL